MRTNGILGAAVLAAAMLAPASQAAPTAPPAGTSPSAVETADAGPEMAVLPASGLVVRPVVDRDGHDAGRVNSVVIDTANGVVEFVLIEGRGGLNLNGELIAIPWTVLQRPTLKDPIRLNITLAQLENAPRIKRDVLFRLDEARWRSRVYGYFGSPYPYNTTAGWYGLYGPLGGGVTRPRFATTETASPAAAGHPARAAPTTRRPSLRRLAPGAGILVMQNGGLAALTRQPPAAPVRPAAAAIATSTDVFTANGVAIGRIRQILVDARTGRVALVRIGKAGMLGVPPVVYPLPIEALRWSAYRDAFELVDSPKLLTELPAMPLAKAHLTMFVSEPKLARLYRHFAIPPFWTEPATATAAVAPRGATTQASAAPVRNPAPPARPARPADQPKQPPS